MINTNPRAAHVFDTRRLTRWEQLLAEEDPDAPYLPFCNEADFCLAAWIVKARLSMANTNSFLKLEAVSSTLTILTINLAAHIYP